MSIVVRCVCGRQLRARADFAGTRAECPTCGRTIEIPHPSAAASQPEATAAPSPAADPFSEALEITEFLDPPTGAPVASAAPAGPPRPSAMRRMFEALLDPRSIQWMLMIGGGLCVLGLIVWLVSLGLFENRIVMAVALGIGTLAILGAGWFVVLRTRFKIAGQALTFLGCVVAPLNLWFYHAQNLVTVDQHLWVGGVVCCLLYAATVYVLRDPLFMYACEIGVTLTTLLLLADMGKITDAAVLSLFFMALGLISIHAERAFAPDPNSEFPRKRFGLPLFWSGHVQIAISLIILLGSQLLGWMREPTREIFGELWPGNRLTENDLLAGGLWLAAVYAYLYSDIVVRKIGVYLALAGVSLVMAELTLLLGFNVKPEWVLTVMALTALAVNVVRFRGPHWNPNLARVIPPVAMALSILPVFAGVILHIRATSQGFARLDWDYATGWEFVVAMLIVAVCNRISAALYREAEPRTSQIYFFLSAAGVLLAAAGQLRDRGFIGWSEQAPWLMLIPLAYLIGSRVWRGRSSERPLYFVAQAATAVIMVHGVLAAMNGVLSVAPMEGLRSSLRLGLVFVEAAVFYFMAGFFHRRSVNAYFAAAAACGALWQFLGYFGVDNSYYTMLYAALGVACLFVARTLGVEETPVYGKSGLKRTVLRGRGLTTLQCGHGILIVACLAAFMQGLAGLATNEGNWVDLASIFATAIAAAVAIVIVPSAAWRRVYATAVTALTAVAFLRLNLLIELNGWQKLEIFCVVVGLIMLAASHWALFRESDDANNDSVTIGLLLGSILAAVPLLIAVLYYRWVGGRPSFTQEIVLLTVTILMSVTGVAWQIRATTLFGGVTLIIYLIVLVVSLAYHPQVAVGVYLAVGGAAIFAAGIALSVYRDKLLQLPDHIAKREGIFRILNWR
jgi:hypothetical protein